MANDIFDNVPEADVAIAMQAARARTIRVTGKLPSINDDEGAELLKLEAKKILDNPDAMANARADIDKNQAIIRRAYPLPNTPGQDFTDVPEDMYKIAAAAARMNLLNQEDVRTEALTRVGVKPGITIERSNQPAIDRETRRIIETPDDMEAAKTNFHRNEQALDAREQKIKDLTAKMENHRFDHSR